MIEYSPWFGYKHPYNDQYAGLPVVEVSGSQCDPPPPDSGSAAWRLTANPFIDGPGGSMQETFRTFFDRADAAAVTAIVIGDWEFGTSSAPIVERLCQEAPRLPALRSLFLGAISSMNCEISWIQQCDVTPLLQAYPQLERLDVLGGSGLAVHPVRHEALRMLRIETGGLNAAVARAVGACDLPALKHLELWLGIETYGGTTTLADLDPILRGERLPALRHLGLQDSERQDEIAAAIAAAPVVARLDSLSLSMGVLTDEGALALLSGQPLTHLRRLDLQHHYLGEEMMRRVREALPEVEVDLSRPMQPDDDEEEDEEPWLYVAVSE
ncbi:STM4015 family protein [Nonomuraea jabiensis]|uniref:STM4015 family protein n=1 Tax=Nonomuraea jabiensis TaxID=882448 RepID=UPI003D75BBDE